MKNLNKTLAIIALATTLGTTTTSFAQGGADTGRTTTPTTTTEDRMNYLPLIGLLGLLGLLGMRRRHDHHMDTRP